MNRIQFLITLVVGAAIGAGATYIITKKKYEETLTIELGEMKDYYQQREARVYNEVHSEDFINAGTIVLDGEKVGEVVEPAGKETATLPTFTGKLNRSKDGVNLYKEVKKTIDYSAASKSKKTSKKKSSLRTEAPEEYFEPKSDEEVGGPDDGWQTAEDEYNNPTAPYLIDEETYTETCLEYPKCPVTLYADGVLVDEDEEMLNITDTIGEIPKAFNYDYGNVAFIRNSKLGIDYEVEKIDSLYSEVVAGFGGPSN